ncbi:DNA packaging tegument protein [Macropodid alphaherpesvirus 1]|uniref:DNA packaging tegument protein n=1 Tax=Macropodid alphaherpesvirus 1 TaxID=137443 RepID=A0A0Y0ABD5_9ALPH|nr:DNA packaging tegument protein [Macropodid alphaherpesvirus 1]AMB17007.1 DNA packaging tegument protein [Macropodid alphaherpesvirus 1]
MDAHLANEVRYDLKRDVDHPHHLVHIIISNGCLTAAGISLSVFTVGVRSRPSIGPQPTQYTSTFRVQVQTRRHGTGECTPWQEVFSSYRPKDTIGEILAPTIPKHPTAIPRTSCFGGLFLSIPIECDTQGVYDPYTLAAVRISWGKTADCAHILLFSYDELLPQSTRYAADRPRVLQLCQHLCNYIYALGPNAPQQAKEAAAHILMGLGTRDELPAEIPGPSSTPSPTPEVLSRTTPIAPEAQLTTVGGDDRNATHTPPTSEPPNEILSLVHKAIQTVMRGDSSRATSSVPGKVASGLKQGVRWAGTTKPEASETSADMVLSGLEPPGRGRFGPSHFNSVPGEEDLLNDVLTLTPGHKKPYSLLDWLDICWVALAEGDRFEWKWSRRAISLVLRHHYETKGRFVVVSYENSMAWGGQNCPQPTLSAELSTALTGACARETVLRPYQLSAAARTELTVRFPMLAPLFRGQHLVLAPFDIAAEVAFHTQMQNICTRALGAAIHAALQNAPHITQRVKYELAPAQNEWIENISHRLPYLLENVFKNINSQDVKIFFQTAYGLSVVRFLGEQGVDGRKWRPLSEDLPPELPDRDTIYAFDYYSTGGETQRLNRTPIIIQFDGDITTTQCRCHLVSHDKDGTLKRICERYLPGESYAYVCLGFNRRLQLVVVFPGGFAFTANILAYLEVPTRAAQAIVGRYCIPVSCGERSVGLRQSRVELWTLPPSHITPK